MVNLEGPIVPIVTPFTDDATTLSEVRLARLVRLHLSQGARAFVCSSDVGEFSTTSFGERKQVLEFVLREAQTKASVVAHVSSLSTTGSLDLAQHAGRHGACCVLMMPPYYGRLTNAEVASHYQVVAHHGGLEVVAVDPMGWIDDELHEMLAKIPRVRFAEPLKDTPYSRLSVRERTANDEFVLGEGVCSPLAAIDVNMLASALDGARMATLLPWCDLMRRAGALRVVKAALLWKDIEVGPMRSPYAPMQPAFMSELKGLVTSSA